MSEEKECQCTTYCTGQGNLIIGYKCKAISTRITDLESEVKELRYYAGNYRKLLKDMSNGMKNPIVDAIDKLLK